MVGPIESRWCAVHEKAADSLKESAAARVQYRFHHHHNLQGKSVHKILWDSFFAVLIAMLLSGLWVVSCGA